MKLKKLVSSVLVGAMLAGTALIGVTAAETTELPFDDVPDKWFKDAVTTVYEEGIMQGKSDTKFDPTANITRAEVVTAFARIACVNIDGKGDALTFTDTKTGKWYSDSVGWAADNGIVKGRGDGRFSPSDNITRAELASIIINFVNYMGLKLPDNAKIDSFSDADTFAKWMKEPVEAVRKTGLMQGVSGMFNPTGNATRAEIAQVIANLLPDTGRVSVVEDGKTDYVIVINEENAAAVDAAERMVWQLEEVCGVTVKVVDDSTKAAAKEIVIGKTDRGTKVDTSSMIRDEFEIAVDGEKVYIDGASADGLYGGAVNFMNTCTSGDDVRFTDKSSYTDKFEYPVGEITIEGNDISKYTVYYPEGAPDNIKTAAGHISYYIEEACGVKIPVKTGMAKDYGIIIETPEYEGEFDDHYTIKSEGTNIVITGSVNRGAQIGAYEFLDKCVGWYLSDVAGDRIDEADKVEITDVDIIRDSFLVYNTRTIDYTKLPYRHPTFAGPSNHSFASLVPEYCSQDENQPCLSDEKVIEAMIAKAREWLEATPNAQMISFSQNDNGNYCKCDECMATYAKYTNDPNNETDGGTAGQMLELVNRMAEEFCDEYPELLIHTFAYTYTFTPPNGITAHDNVIVQVCFLGDCMRHSLTDYCRLNSYEITKKWGEITNQMCVWDYPFNWNFNFIPNPVYSYENNIEDCRAYEELGVNFRYSNSNMGRTTGEFTELRYNLIGRLHNDPYMTEDEYYHYMKAFLESFYGPAWEDVYDVIMLVEENYDACLFANDDNFMAMGMYMRSYIGDLITTLGDARLDTVTKAQWERVDREMIQYEVIDLNSRFDTLYKSSKAEDNALVQELSKALYSKILKYGIRLSGNVPAPPLPEKFERGPGWWREWAYISADSNRDYVYDDPMYDENGNWLEDPIWYEDEAYN